MTKETYRYKEAYFYFYFYFYFFFLKCKNPDDRLNIQFNVISVIRISFKISKQM